MPNIIMFYIPPAWAAKALYWRFDLLAEEVLDSSGLLDSFLCILWDSLFLMEIF